MERILSIKEKMHLAFFPTTQKHIISREALCFDKSVVQNTINLFSSSPNTKRRRRSRTAGGRLRVKKMRGLCAATLLASVSSSSSIGSSKSTLMRRPTKRVVMGVPKPTGDGANRKKNIIIKASKGAAEENGGGGTPNNPNQMLIYVPPHPLLKHWLAVARNAASPSALFRSAMAEIGKILMYELSRDWLETYEAQVQGPLAVANVEVVDPSKAISIVPVLRAGLTLVDKAHEVLPTTKTYHLGYARDETTLEATKYLDKLPKNGFSKEDKVLISDPMLATGGTIVRAVQDVLDKGADVKNVRVMCCVAAPPALTKLSESFPGLVVYAAIIDENVTEEGFILPGLGDAGDRAFGTD